MVISNGSIKKKNLNNRSIYNYIKSEKHTIGSIERKFAVLNIFKTETKHVRV